MCFHGQGGVHEACEACEGSTFSHQGMSRGHGACGNTWCSDGQLPSFALQHGGTFKRQKKPEPSNWATPADSAQAGSIFTVVISFRQILSTLCLLLVLILICIQNHFLTSIHRNPSGHPGYPTSHSMPLLVMHDMWPAGGEVCVRYSMARCGYSPPKFTSWNPQQTDFRDCFLGWFSEKNGPVFGSSFFGYNV